ncbi:polysaccharide deacetylase family protein [Thiolapillus sp.]
MVGRIFPRWLLFRGPHPSGKVLALSFDDGPHPEHSSGILDALGEAGVHATFFVVGEEAEKYPHLVRRMLDEGHQVANHTHIHYGLQNSTSKEYVADVEYCQALLENICGQKLERSFRPPYGSIPPAVFMRLVSQGYRMVLWSVDSDDSRLENAADLVRSISRKELIAGDVLLLHEDYAHTLEALPDILCLLRKRGFDFVTCSEL